MGDIITGEPLRSALENANEKKEKGAALEPHDAKAPSSSADSGSPTGGKLEDGADAQPKTAPAAESANLRIKDAGVAEQGTLPLDTAPTDEPQDKGPAMSPVEVVTVAKADDLTVAKEPENVIEEEERPQADGVEPPVGEASKTPSVDQEPAQEKKTPESGVRINSPDKAKLVKSRIRLPNFTLGGESKGVLIPLPGREGGDKPLMSAITWGRIEEKDGKWFLFPEEPGDDLWFNADYADGTSVRFDIIVNQDPRKLWLVKEPEDRTFEKPHTATLFHEWKDFQVSGASRRGRSHEHSGSFRDDDMGVWADEATGRYVFIVADGAGSAKYSREGSRRAIEEVLAKLDANLTVQLWDADGDKLPRDGQIAKKLCGLGLFANDKLKSFVEAENQKHPDDKYEIKNFNTTFLIVAAKKDQDGSVRLVSFSVGDGAIAWYTGSDFGLMCSPDGGEYSGGTRFLTTESVWKKAREDWTAFCNARVFTRRIPASDVGRLAIFLMTDGVSDPMFETDANLQSIEKWHHLAEDELKGQGGEQAKILDSDTAENKANKMLEWLNFWSVGNHDDRTIIAVYPQAKDVKEAK